MQTALGHLPPYAPQSEATLYFVNMNRSNQNSDPGIDLNDKRANIRYLTQIWSNWANMNTQQSYSANQFLSDFQKTIQFFNNFEYQRMHNSYIRYARQSNNIQGETFENFGRNITQYDSLLTMYSDVGAVQDLEFRTLARQLVWGLLGKSVQKRFALRPLSRFRYVVGREDLVGTDTLEDILETKSAYNQLGAENIFEVLQAFREERMRGFSIILLQEVILLMKIYPNIDRIIKTTMESADKNYSRTIIDSLEELIEYNRYKDHLDQIDHIPHTNSRDVSEVKFLENLLAFQKQALHYKNSACRKFFKN